MSAERVFGSRGIADNGRMWVIAFGDRGGYWRSMKLLVAGSWCFRADWGLVGVDVGDWCLRACLVRVGGWCWCSNWWSGVSVRVK